MEKKIPRARLIDRYEDMFKPMQENFVPLAMFLATLDGLDHQQTAVNILKYFHEKQKHARASADAS